MLSPAVISKSVSALLHTLTCVGPESLDELGVQMNQKPKPELIKKIVNQKRGAECRFSQSYIGWRDMENAFNISPSSSHTHLCNHTPSHTQTSVVLPLFLTLLWAELQTAKQTGCSAGEQKPGGLLLKIGWTERELGYESSLVLRKFIQYDNRNKTETKFLN